MSSTQTETGSRTATQVFRIYINASPERVWAAITTPEFSRQYGYTGDVEYDLRPDGDFNHRASAQMKEMGMPDTVVTGRVIESDPPRRLVQTWNPVWNEEPATTLTFQIESADGTVSRLTLTHELAGAPQTAAEVEGAGPLEHMGGGGWPWVLSEMKTVLERG